jgi:hypothetical protein
MQRIKIIVLLFFSAATVVCAQEPGQFYLQVGGQIDKLTRGDGQLEDQKIGALARVMTADLGIIFAVKEPAQSGDARCGFLAKPIHDAVLHLSGSGVARCGFLVEGALGQGGARYSAGVWAIDNTSFYEGEVGGGLDVRVVMNHTFSSPRHATPDSNYVGFEAGLRFGYIFRASAGVAHRVSGPPGRQGTIFTWSGGVQIPVPLFKIR